MQLLKNIQLLALVTLPLLINAQVETKSKVKPTSSPTDCPTWDGKKPQSRSNFLEYLRNNQGKKVSNDSPYASYVKTISGEKPQNDSVTQPHKAENNFYTQKRYNITSGKAETKAPIASKEANAIPPGNALSEPSQAEKTHTPQISSSIESLPAAKNPSAQKSTEQKDQSEVAPDSKEIATTDKENGATKVESTKNTQSKFKKKLTRIFSKKTNKAAKPNYEKCTTRF